MVLLLLLLLLVLLVPLPLLMPSVLLVLALLLLLLTLLMVLVLLLGLTIKVLLLFKVLLLSLMLKLLLLASVDVGMPAAKPATTNADAKMRRALMLCRTAGLGILNLERSSWLVLLLLSEDRLPGKEQRGPIYILLPAAMVTGGLSWV
jgi:hypothetical protein